MTKTLIAAAALTIAWVSAAAAECSGQRHVMSCADGMVFDPDSRTCIATSS
ncbi:carbohydrate-binding module family 14 protein [Roseivivax sp. CAU 1761]